MPKCCGASCDCNIQAGAGTLVEGTGSIGNPFVISATGLTVGSLASGSVTAPAPAALNTSVPVTVTFPVGRFTVPPVVVVQYGGASALSHQIGPSVLSGLGTGGVTINTSRTGGVLTATTCLWLAYGA